MAYLQKCGRRCGNPDRCENLAEGSAKQRACRQWSAPRAFFRPLAFAVCSVVLCSAGVLRRVFLLPIPAGMLCVLTRHSGIMTKC